MGRETTPPAQDGLTGLRRFIRASEIGLVLLAALIGALAGLVVVAMNQATQLLHVVLFGIGLDAHLSITDGLNPLALVAVPVLGGLVFALASAALRGTVSAAPVDPIEANALFGGRMSARDSLFVAGQTMLSSGVGASVGLEAGYTQAAGGLASRIGQAFHLRRSDLRLLVGCGAGAAIGAAFNAPLMGAFYGFELVLGTYAIPSFVPMMTASFTATLTRQALLPTPETALPALAAPTAGMLPFVLLLGFACALIGIAVMRGVTLVEAGFRASALPPLLRPAVGGLVIGGLAVWNPTVLSAGHGAVAEYLVRSEPLALLAGLLVAKVAASAVSIGSGFRGGLFFASLLMGVFAGRAYAAGLDWLVPGLAGEHAFYALIGMSALAVAVVGGPMTMTLLALEMTGDLGLTLAVLAAAATASLTTRRLFGFSFATWRFHLRGQNIRGAHDIGWLRQLTVASLMRREVSTLPADLPLAEARSACPPGTVAVIVATEPDGRYAGLVPVALLHEAAEEGTAGTLRPLLRHGDDVLAPDMTIADALAAFTRVEADALVVAGPDRQVVGLLSEAQAVRRYGEEMGRRLGEITGEPMDGRAE